MEKQRQRGRIIDEAVTDGETKTERKDNRKGCYWWRNRDIKKG